MRTLLATIFWLAIAVNGAFAQNAIVTENQLVGTPQSQWDLSGPGSTTLQGFATDISVNHGSTVNFKIQAGTKNWRIDIYRLGYYQGNGARLITTHQQDERSKPAGAGDQFGDWRGGCGQLGGNGVMGCPRQRGIRRLHRPSRGSN